MKIPIVILLAANLLAGCASTRPYNAAAVTAIRELVFRTKAVLEDGDAGRLSVADSRQFLKESKGKVEDLRRRTTEFHLSTEELAILDSLDRQYDALLLRRHPLRSRAASQLTATLDALQDLRPLPESMPEIPVGYCATDDTSSTDTSSTKSKDCGKNGHDNRDCGCQHDHR